MNHLDLPKRIVFWQNMISPHQVAYIRSLAEEKGLDVVWVAGKKELRARSALGWQPPATGRVVICEAPGISEVAELLNTRRAESLHVVSGFRDHKFAARVLRENGKGGVRCGVVAEGANPRGARNPVRRALFRLIALRYRRQVDFLLAMGRNGCEWYRRTGWPAEKLFEFCYTVDGPPENGTTEREGVARSGVRIVYVGRLEHAKGIDLLIRALGAVARESDFRLQLVGSGAAEPYRLLAREAGIERRIEFLGVKDNSSVREIMRSADCLVLPSRGDGWGAVVNEALMVGTPVLCSTDCGARDLLTDCSRGAVVKTEDHEAWARALSAVLANGMVTESRRRQIFDWASRISGSTVADYFLAVLGHVYGDCPRPSVPWRG